MLYSLPLSLLLLCCTSPATSHVIFSNASSNLVKDVEDFHDSLFDLVEKFLDIEATIGDLGIDSDLRERSKSFRKKLTDLPEDLFHLQLKINSLDLKDDHGHGKGNNNGNSSNCEKTWHLAMNLNPADGHYMDYLTGWSTGTPIGTEDKALTMDYLDRLVWKEPIDNIAIVRHQHGVVDAVKVFKFKHWGLSLLERFKDLNPGRVIASRGGPVQVSIDPDALNLDDDPIFSVDGDLALNWWSGYRGSRIQLTGGFDAGVATTYHGLGNHMSCNCQSNGARDNNYRYEVSNIQNCPFSSCSKPVIQGTDRGSTSYFVTGPVYGNYALYVSRNSADRFPEPGYELEIQIDIC